MKLFIGLIAFLCLIYYTQALSCTAQWQCTSVSTDYNYVSCNAGQCQCLTSNGFVGSATATSKCGCPSGYTITWVNGAPYCYSIPNAIAFQQQNDRCNILKGKITSLYNGLIWPSSRNIMLSLIAGVPSTATTLFANVSIGRVDPAGEFANFAGLTEYFYGTLWLGSTRVPSVDIRLLLCNGNKVSVRLNIFFQQFTSTDGTQLEFVYNLTQSGFYSFDDNNLINGTDLIIHNLGKVSNPKTPPGPDMIGGVCYLYAQAGCTPTDDPTGFYSDFNDCFAFLSGTPFGTWDDLRMNTVLCRYYHVLLALADKVHCKHVGKNGGGKCYDHTYESYYLTEYVV